MHYHHKTRLTPITSLLLYSKDQEEKIQIEFDNISVNGKNISFSDIFHKITFCCTCEGNFQFGGVFKKKIESPKKIDTYNNSVINQIIKKIKIGLVNDHTNLQ